MADEDREKEIERFKAELQIKIAERQAELDLELEKQRDEYAQNLAKIRAAADDQRSASVENSKTVVHFASITLRGIVLINGGAAIAILAFIGQLWGKNDNGSQAVAIAAEDSLMFFVFGAGLGIIATFLAYLSQDRFFRLPDGSLAETIDKWRPICRFLAFCSAAIGLLFFFLGTYSAMKAYKIGPPPEVAFLDFIL